MTTALQNGSAGVIPCLNIDDAFALRNRDDQFEYLLGGERGGLKIDGFDFGNSPASYSSNVVSGRRLGFTTTNGTKAIHHSQQAAEIVIGCFANFTAVLSYVQNDERPVHIVCAGTNGEISSEDVLFGGALADAVLDVPEHFTVTDSTRLAVDHWQAQCGVLKQSELCCAIRRSQGGKNLIKLNYDSDIELCSDVDSLLTVGRIDSEGVILPVDLASTGTSV
ncbi:UNVERIFIED_CONTAM: hypothetical protein GTU68_006170 [Idotea baltica]|nr:hypothetical protein [Idotea baltica]